MVEQYVSMRDLEKAGIEEMPYMGKDFKPAYEEASPEGDISNARCCMCAPMPRPVCTPCRI